LEVDLDGNAPVTRRYPVIDTPPSTPQKTPVLNHEALLYRHSDELGDVIRDFVTEAGASGEPVLVVLPPESLEVAKNALAQATRDVRFEDMSELGHNPSCLISVYEAWIEEHEGPVRMVAEAVWPGRSYAEIVECLRHEALVNQALGASPAWLMCPYDAGRLGSDTLVGAEMTHPQIVEPGHRRRPSRHYADRLDVLAAAQWPQEPASEPVSELAFGGDLYSLRHAVAADPVTGSLDLNRISDLVFVVNEAATNALRHGDGEYTTRLWHDGASVVSEVWTSSRVEDLMVGRRRPPPHGPGGRGLWLINQLCDLVELRSSQGGTSLRMHMRDPVL
jgi:anti-sigma regulatory factor (Ser/Thr protein kinase)